MLVPDIRGDHPHQILNLQTEITPESPKEVTPFLVSEHAFLAKKQDLKI
jgi:hypothetical protein